MTILSMPVCIRATAGSAYALAAVGAACDAHSIALGSGIPCHDLRPAAR